MEKTELLQAIKDNRLVEYVSTNYWKMTKEQLQAIAVQMMFTLYDNGIKPSTVDVNELLERLDLD